MGIDIHTLVHVILGFAFGISFGKKIATKHFLKKMDEQAKFREKRHKEMFQSLRDEILKK